MTAHWWLALRYSVVVAVAALFTGMLIWLYWSKAQAWAFEYGVSVGLAGFISTAGTVSMLTVRSGFMRAVGAASFIGRYLFIGAALGIPAYYGMWDVVPMLAGFAAVYLMENVLLLPGILRARGENLSKLPERAEGRAST